ncbi:MAG: S9 family peptidase, partial [Bryobacteraceae bacterium]
MRLNVSLFFFVAALCAGTAVSEQSNHKQPVTIDDLVARHYFRPIAPIWRPDGMAFAYVEKGAVRLYDIRSRKSRVWFETATLQKAAKKPAERKPYDWQDRNVAPETYEWFPNGKDLLAFVKGELFVVHAGGQFERLTKTAINAEEAKLSPDGKQVLYRAKSNLYVLNLAAKTTRRLTRDGTATLLNGKLDWVYPEELDISTAMWWSPDSKRIAYLQFNVSDEFVYPHADLLGKRAVSEPERYPQAGTPNALVKLGVVSAGGGETKWMKAGDSPNALLARVAWLPDSSAIALERLNRVQNRLDLLFCNPATGDVRTAIHEQSKTWINVADNLRLLKSRPEFLWTSERSGFRHIYRYSDSGKLLGQITRGNWEVKTIAAVDEPHREIYFTSSEESPLETQLYRVGFDGGARTRLTSAGCTHTIHANKGGSYYLDTYSSLKQPPETVLRSAAGSEVAVLQPADKKQLERYDLLPTEIVRVKAPDGTVLYARLIKPAGFREGVKYPAIVYVYGGPQAQSIRNQWYGMDWDQVLAQRGYVIWQLDNRGSYGRGHAFEAVIYRQMGKQEVADQRLGVAHLIRMGFVDPKRIGITGWSYGGYMTIRCMLLAPDVFKVGVAGAPVTDWHNYDTIYTERYLGLPGEDAKGYDASSDVKHAAELQGKLLIVHN